MAIHDTQHRLGFGSLEPILLKVLVSVPCALRFIKHDNLLGRGLVRLFQPFTNKHMDILYKGANGALAAAFQQASSMIASNCRRYDFYKRTVPRQKHTGWTTFAAKGRIVNDV